MLVVFFIGIAVVLSLLMLSGKFRNVLTRRAKLLVLLIIIIVVFLAGYLYFSNFLEIDRCLDKGGRWNNEMNICEQ